MELSAPAVIERIDAGAYPREVVLTIARGFLPLAQEDLIAVLSYLASTTDVEIAETARVALTEVPARSILTFAANEQAPPEALERLMRATSDAAVLETLVRNRAVGDEAVAELAARAGAALQEVIVINQARIIRFPAILDALLANPRLSSEVRRRSLETREEFFSKKARAQEAAAAALPQAGEGEDDEERVLDLPIDAIADLLAKAREEGIADAVEPPPPPPVDATDVKAQSAFTKILNMSVGEKVQLAFKGGKTERGILVRDRNKLVCSSVMRNPRMSESEVELIAGMRNIEEEVLRLCAMKREWMAKYPIVLALVRNPKGPIGVVLPLINRLTLRDLKALKDDKGVSEAVRSVARRAFTARSQKS
jgi:hypothetical protein